MVIGHLSQTRNNKEHITVVIKRGMYNNTLACNSVRVKLFYDDMISWYSRW